MDAAPNPPTATFELRIGERWLVEAKRLQQGDAARWVGATYDPDVLRARVDLVIAGENVTDDLPDEPVAAFLRSCAGAVRALRHGARRARVEWAESPFELTIERRGDSAWLSFYGLGAGGAFRAERVALSASMFDRVVSATVDGVRRDASAAEIPLDAALAPPPREQRAAPSLPVDGERPVPMALATNDAAGFVIATTIDPASTGLLDGDAVDAFDRHLLLARGTCVVSARGGASVSLGERPIRSLELLVDALHDARPGGAGAHRTPLVAPPVGEVHVDVRASGDVEFSDAAAGRVRIPFDSACRLVGEHVGGIGKALLGQSASLAEHALLGELLRAAAEIRAASDAPPLVPLASRGASPPARRAPDAGALAFSPTAIRRMRYERGWSWTAPGLRARSLWPMADGTFHVRHDAGLTAIGAHEGPRALFPILASAAARPDDEGGIYAAGASGVTRFGAEGQALWTAAARPGTPPRLCRLDTAVVVSTAGGRLSAFGAERGDHLWDSAKLGVPGSLTAGHGVVLVVLGREVVALDAETGRPAWRRAIGYERVAVRVVGEHVVVVGDDPLRERCCVGTLDLASGEWQRRHEAAADVLAVSWRPSDGVAVLVRDDRGARLLVVDGGAERDWTLAVPARLRGQLTCSMLDDGVIVSGEDGLLRLGPDGEDWRLVVPGDVFGPVRRSRADGFVFVVTATEVRVLEASGGRELHRIPAFWEHLAVVAANAAGDLVLVEDGPGGVLQLHGVRSAGFLAALEGGKAAG